jgi:hypothetical protein
LTRRIIPMRHAFAFQATKKPLRHCIVSTLSLATHATLYSMVRQKPAVGMTGVLSTTITMVKEAGWGLTPTECHR